MKVIDRSIRSLMGLNGASTSRVLNLAGVERAHGQEPEYRSDAFFKSSIINSSILLKHRLRSDEDYLFGKGKTTATKIILPFDKSDLKSGGRSMFVDQRGFADNLLAIGGYKSMDGDFERDVQVLRLIDTLPSLDPFILREYLARHAFKIADCYFNISKPDQTRMKEYVADQVRKLSQMAAGDDNASDDVSTPRLAVSLLHNTFDQKLEVLQRTFELEEDECREGAFAWRGFLYYKWRMETLLIDTRRIVKQIALVQPSGRINSEQRTFIMDAKAQVAKSADAVTEDVRAVIARYDTVYNALLVNQDPKAFRAFLLAAPPLFTHLGEMIGAIEHIVSYWKYRFPEDEPLTAEAGELEDIFHDFVVGFPKKTVTLKVAV